MITFPQLVFPRPPPHGHAASFVRKQEQVNVLSITSYLVCRIFLLQVKCAGMVSAELSKEECICGQHSELRSHA